MKIGIIGAGNIGANVAKLFVEAGHDVAISNEDPGSLAGLVKELGSRAQAGTVDDAAKFGEVVFLAVHWRSPEALPDPSLVAGKVVIDAMNHFAEDMSIYDLGNSTSSEEVKKRLSQARLVKAFNTIWFEHLKTQARRDLPIEERRVIPVAGDDLEAKEIVSRLIEEIGFAAIDSGSLRDGGRKQEPEQLLYNKDIKPAEAQALLRD